VEPEASTRILLVDDEVRNLIALEAVLDNPCWQLVRARSGRETLRRMLDDDYAVVLLDVLMPDLDGFETAELIRGRERSRKTPIIFLTAAQRDEVEINRGYALGAVDFIVKPCDPVVLRSKVAVFVELFEQTRRAEREARELAETTLLLNSVLDGSLDHAIVAIDLDGRFVLWNEGARRLYGYTAEETIGRAGLDLLYTPEAVASGHVAELLEQAREHGRTSGECIRVTRDGRQFTASIAINQRYDAQGRPIGFMSISRDISALKQAEQERAQLVEEQAARRAAEASRDRLQQVIAVSPLAIAVAGQDGHVLACNRAMVALVGPEAAQPDASIAEACAWLEPDGQPCPSERVPLRRALRGEVVDGEELLLVARDPDRNIPVLASAAPLHRSDGTVDGAVCVFQDITPIKALERDKDAFLAAAAHDLRNPLAVIKARAQLALRRANRLPEAERDRVMDGLRDIDTTIQKTTALVNEILDVARLQLGRPLDLDLQPVDMVQLLRRVADDVRATTDRHNVLLRLGPARLVGEWDAARLERVIANLVSNAVKFSPRGGRVEIALSVETAAGQDWAVVEVCDEGVGIPADDLPRIFDRFFRAGNVSDRFEGTGIGLFTVRQTVEQFGGFIEVESEPGHGSTFTVRLPFQREAAGVQSLPIGIAGGG
jgi:PAS domain S-box-containing protein